MEMRSLVTVEGSRLSSSITKPVFRAASFCCEELFGEFGRLEGLERLERRGYHPPPYDFVKDMRAKGLARPRTISRRVVAASDDVEDWGDFPEMWQAKGLRGKQEELWK